MPLQPPSPFHQHIALPERTALAALYKLERYTMELVKTNKEILHLSKEFEQKYLRGQ